MAKAKEPGSEEPGVNKKVEAAIAAANDIIAVKNHLVANAGMEECRAMELAKELLCPSHGKK